MVIYYRWVVSGLAPLHVNNSSGAVLPTLEVASIGLDPSMMIILFPHTYLTLEHDLTTR